MSLKKSIFKVSASVLLGVAVLSSVAFADASPSQTPVTTGTVTTYTNAFSGSVAAQPHAKKVIKISNLGQWEKETGIKPPRPGAKLIGVTRVIDDTSSSSTSSTISPNWTGTGYYLQNVQQGGNSDGTSVIRDSYYTGPATATMTVSSSVSATWSANCSVSADVVSGGVGFSVTASYTVSDSYQVSVPAGSTYEVRAYPVFSNTSYDVWYDPWIGPAYQAGSGNASKPIGVDFSQWSV